MEPDFEVLEMQTEVLSLQRDFWHQEIVNRRRVWTHRFRDTRTTSPPAAAVAIVSPRRRRAAPRTASAAVATAK